MRIKDMVRLASSFAQAGDPKRQFLLCSIGIRKDGAVVISRNERSVCRNPAAHAEARLVRKLGFDAPMILVVRILKNGDLAMAKPCPDCERALRAYRVKKIFYTTENGIEQLDQ